MSQKTVKRRVDVDDAEPSQKRPRKETEKNSIFVFGNGDTGQLGLGNSILVSELPTSLMVKKNIINDIACGTMHSIALTANGQLYSWGCNDHHALGRTGNRSIPGLVKTDAVFVKVACGESVSVALTKDGKVYGWGMFQCSEGELGFSKDKSVQYVPMAVQGPVTKNTIVDIAAGANHCLALTDKGNVFGWGNGELGQLGRRVLGRHKLNGLRPALLPLKNIKAIGSGSNHSFALSQSNDLYVWGLNNFGQCGLWNDDETHAKDKVITQPTVIHALQGKGPIKSVAAGDHHSYVLMEDGTVYSFGLADFSQLGLPEDLINERLANQNDMVDGGGGDASKNSEIKRVIGQPTQIPGLTNVDEICSGDNHALVKTRDGKVYAWGSESFALGNGSEKDEPVPRQVTESELGDYTVLKVAAGAQHSLILAENSTN